MIKGFRVWSLVVLLVICFIISKADASRMSIEIGRPSSVIFNIAIPDFYDIKRKGASYEYGNNLRKILIADLEIYGIFNVMDKRVYIESSDILWNEQRVNLRSWSVIGADLLLKTGYSTQENKLEILFSLIDVTKGDTIVSKAATGNISDVRYLIHMVADEIFKAVTGEVGILTSKVAFVSSQKGNKEIFIADIDGMDIQNITSYGTITMLPRVSPDGRGILFISYKDQNGPQLFFKDLASGTVRCLSVGANSANSGAWMPDGKRVIAGLTVKGNQDLFMLDLNGTVIRQLTDFPGIEVGPCVSPDGTKLAFVSDREGTPQVYVMDINGGRPMKVSREGKYNSSPAWSIKNQIAYASLLDGNFDIVVTDPEGIGSTRITSGGANHEDPTWGPNGRYLIYASNKNGKYGLYLQGTFSKISKALSLGEGEQRMPFWFSVR